MRGTETSEKESTALAAVLREGTIESVFQPIVDLVTEATVAFEALSRGPLGSPLREPVSLFGIAREENRLRELDWACRLSAFRSALRARLRPPMTIFVNVEPEVLDDDPPLDHDHVLARAMGGLRVVVELTERALLARPAALLNYVEELRRCGWGIAVDDIGKHPHSIAMLSVIEPDIVKLDRSMLQEMQPSDATELVSGVHAYCRRSGALIVAEGLETPEDVSAARAAGAQLGQGWALGGPTSTPAVPVAAAHPIPLISPRPHLPTRRLITMTTRQTPATAGERREVDRLTRYISEYAAHLGRRALVVIGAQNRDQLTPDLLATVEALATQVPYVALIGAGVSTLEVPGVQTVEIGSADPLASEWVVLATGLNDSIALVASDLGDDAARLERRYDFTVSYDPVLVTDIARSAEPDPVAPAAGTHATGAKRERPPAAWQPDTRQDPAIREPRSHHTLVTSGSCRTPLGLCGVLGYSGHNSQRTAGKPAPQLEGKGLRASGDARAE